MPDSYSSFSHKVLENLTTMALEGVAILYSSSSRSRICYIIRREGRFDQLHVKGKWLHRRVVFKVITTA